MWGRIAPTEAQLIGNAVYRCASDIYNAVIHYWLSGSAIRVYPYGLVDTMLQYDKVGEAYLFTPVQLTLFSFNK